MTGKSQTASEIHTNMKKHSLQIHERTHAQRTHTNVEK